MPTELDRVRRTFVVLLSAGLLITGVVLARGSAASPDSPTLRAGTAPLPAVVAGSSAPVASTPTSADTTATAAARDGSGDGARPSVVHPGVPVAIDIPIRTADHPDGVHTTITADALNRDGSLHVPDDPRIVSWAAQDAEPGSGRGTAILVSHVDYVVDGRTVSGAFSDLAEYARKSIGRRFTVTLADGHRLVYGIVAGREYSKAQLAADPLLRKGLFDQAQVFGRAGRPSGRLLLVSCGGAFDPTSGEYEDNVFLYALPVG